LYALAKNAECPSSSNIAAKSRDFNFLDIFGHLLYLYSRVNIGYLWLMIGFQRMIHHAKAANFGFPTTCRQI
jgi:hypothetical protein